MVPIKIHILMMATTTYSDDEEFHEIEDYTDEADKGEQVQGTYSPQYLFSSHVMWSAGASSSGGARPSTSGVLPVDVGSRYICEDWVSRLSTKQLGYISFEYRLGQWPR